MLKIAWKLLKGRIETWLQTRALILPATKQAEIAVQWKVDVGLVNALNQEIANQAAKAVETFKV